MCSISLAQSIERLSVHINGVSNRYQETIIKKRQHTQEAEDRRAMSRKNNVKGHIITNFVVNYRTVDIMALAVIFGFHFLFERFSVWLKFHRTR